MSSKTKTTATKEEARPVLVPKLRFPEFRDAPGWERTTLGEVTTKTDRRNKGGKSYPVYSINNKAGFTPQGEQFAGVDSEKRGYDLALYKIVEQNTFAYNPARINVGSIGYSGDLNNIIISSLYVCFQTKAGVDDRFLMQFFGTSEFEGSVSNNAEGGIRSYLFYETFSLINLLLPALREQQKIAECLSSVDELMAAQARKVDALKTHKKGLMQQLFPREGETQPRLRFPEFQSAGEWEMKRLDELVDIQSGATPSKANPAFWNGSVPWVSAKDMKRLFLEDAEDHISAEAVDDGARLVPKGTLLMLTRGMTLLKDVPICVLRREMSFNQDVKGLRPKEGVDGLFLAWMLTGNKQRLLAMVNVAGHGTGKLDTDELKALELSVPPPLEQQRIALCLSSLDDLITAETQKLEALKTHKKGLMQQLFPSPEEVEA